MAPPELGKLNSPEGTSAPAGDQALVSPAPPDRRRGCPSPGHGAAHGRAPLGLGTCQCAIPSVTRLRSPETPRRRTATSSAGHPTSPNGRERSSNAALQAERSGRTRDIADYGFHPWYVRRRHDDASYQHRRADPICRSTNHHFAMMGVGLR
jgi:hypothetical protein